MAQLGGRTVRSLVTSLELLSDDEGLVLMLDRSEDGSVRLRTRKPWESTWASEGDSFSVKAADARVIANLFSSSDVSWNRSQLDDIPTTDFDKPNPNTANEAEVARQVEERCSQLDIERAKAANIQQEFILDHSRDRHVTADVPGCPSCEAKVIPSIPVERSSDEDEELPF